MGGFGEGLGSVWERFWEGFGEVWEPFGHSRPFSASFWTSQAARWRVRTVRGLKSNHLTDVATFGAFFSSFFLASMFWLEVA